MRPGYDDWTIDAIMPAAFAIGAHPDDIEFHFAGTLLLLRDAGWTIHYMNLSSGNLGSMVTDGPATARIRRREAQAAARILGAEWHPPIAHDLEIFFNKAAILRLAATLRRVNPRILLTHPPVDYMEDHTNTCRLVVTAAFVRGFPNLKTRPQRPPVSGDIALYHGMPHGLHTPLREPVTAEIYVDTTRVHPVKREALAAHASQKDWLDQTQGMDSYLRAMDDMSLAVGRQSGRFKYAEGWRRHLHLGYSTADDDPLSEVLGTLVRRKTLRRPGGD